MKTIRRLALLSLLVLAAASCSSSVLAPECDDPAACDYQPGSNG